MYVWRCGDSMVAHQTSGAVDPGTNLASHTIILGRCRIIVKYCKNLRVTKGLKTKKNYIQI